MASADALGGRRGHPRAWGWCRRSRMRAYPIGYHPMEGVPRAVFPRRVYIPRYRDQSAKNCPGSAESRCASDTSVKTTVRVASLVPQLFSLGPFAAPLSRAPQAYSTSSSSGCCRRSQSLPQTRTSSPAYTTTALPGPSFCLSAQRPAPSCLRRKLPQRRLSLLQTRSEEPNEALTQPETGRGCRTSRNSSGGFIRAHLPPTPCLPPPIETHFGNVPRHSR
jgi:hypothetical protein